MKALVIALAAVVAPAKLALACADSNGPAAPSPAPDRPAARLSAGESKDAVRAPLRQISSVFNEPSSGSRLDHGSGRTALDEGGGASAETRQIMALLFGLVLGFGVGHLIAHDKDGFIVFLIIDIGIIALATVLDIVVHTNLFWVFGGLALVVSHVIQGIDAYAAAGGSRLAQGARERAIVIAGSRGEDGPVPSTGLLRFSF